VVDGIHRCPNDAVVAILADIRSLHVQCGFACRINPVMATKTVAGDIGMVEYRRNPAVRIMAVVALFARRDVIGRLAGCEHTVVAGAAAAGNRCVIHEHHRAPGRRRMAVSTKFR